MKKKLSVLLTLLIVFSICIFPIDSHAAGKVNITKSEINKIVSMEYKEPKNIILMIGDGMGPNDIAITEKYGKGLFAFGLAMNQIKNTGFSTTSSYGGAVTDSAAGGTALATGVKTYNGVVGLSPKGEKLTNISELARSKGKKVGIVTNDEITGATPSAFVCHRYSRTDTAALVKDFLSFKPDVLIGQGKGLFSARDLNGVAYADTYSKFSRVIKQDPKKTKPFIGVFSEDFLQDKSSNMLANCTEIALNRLNGNKEGFFLMVENAGTDVFGHNKLIKGKMNTVITFDRAVATVLKFMKNNPDTLLIITSDHETGGVQLPKSKNGISNSLFTTNDHTGINVRTFAVGKGSEYFNGKTVDNTDIAKYIINVINGK